MVRILTLMGEFDILINTNLADPHIFPNGSPQNLSRLVQ